MKYYSVVLYYKGYKVERNKGKTKVSLPPTCALAIKKYIFTCINILTCIHIT